MNSEIQKKEKIKIRPKTSVHPYNYKHNNKLLKKEIDFTEELSDCAFNKEKNGLYSKINVKKFRNEKQLHDILVKCAPKTKVKLNFDKYFSLHVDSIGNKLNDKISLLKANYEFSQTFLKNLILEINKAVKLYSYRNTTVNIFSNLDFEKTNFIYQFLYDKLKTYNLCNTFRELFTFQFNFNDKIHKFYSVVGICIFEESSIDNLNNFCEFIIDNSLLTYNDIEIKENITTEFDSNIFPSIKDLTVDRKHFTLINSQHSYNLNITEGINHKIYDSTYNNLIYHPTYLKIISQIKEINKLNFTNLKVIHLDINKKIKVDKINESNIDNFVEQFSNYIIEQYDFLNKYFSNCLCLIIKLNFIFDTEVNKYNFLKLTIDKIYTTSVRKYYQVKQKHKDLNITINGYLEVNNLIKKFKCELNYNLRFFSKFESFNLNQKQLVAVVLCKVRKIKYTKLHKSIISKICSFIQYTNIRFVNKNVKCK